MRTARASTAELDAVVEGSESTVSDRTLQRRRGKRDQDVCRPEDGKVLVRMFKKN